MPFDVTHAFVSAAALFGIWKLWGNLNEKFTIATINLLIAPFREKEEDFEPPPVQVIDDAGKKAD